MRASQWFLSTQRETPAEAELVSHKLMLRAGMIRKLASGLYSWMPLGLKVLRKIEAIVREEMDKAGGLEVLMPAVQPAELWKETKRWDSFGGLLLTMQDSNEREYCFGPTHEEVITDIARSEIHSYKQLPVIFYQIQAKFRDEIRPRFGVMRAREFIMKDAYSFHLTQESLKVTYELMYQTYCKIFDRLGLRYRAVEADTGAIGGSASHEFQVLAESGEDLIFYSDKSSYAANVEQATSLAPTFEKNSKNHANLTLVDTPAKKTIAEVTGYLNLAANKLIKTLIVEGESNPLVALVLVGNDDLNEIKAEKHPLVKSPLTMATEEQIQKAIGCASGFLGPINLDIPIIVDYHARAMQSFACGANQKDKHYINAVWERDAHSEHSFDLRRVKEGDQSPDGQGQLKSCRGIEVGHVFQLGDKYAEAMSAKVISESGQLQTMLMGCYGIGVSRIVAAAIEQHHDEKGIIWPEAIAPFCLVLIPVNAHRSHKVKQTTEQLYQELTNMGLDILLDDRNERPGVLFADAELIGIPHRIVVSEKLLENENIEYKARAGNEVEVVKIAELKEFLTHLIQ